MKTEKRPMDIELLKDLARQFAQEYKETALIGLDTRGGIPGIQIEYIAISEVAPLEMWTWTKRERPGSYPWRASVTIDGIEFRTVCTDKEKAEALAETDESLDKEPMQ